MGVPATPAWKSPNPCRAIVGGPAKESVGNRSGRNERRERFRMAVSARGAHIRRVPTRACLLTDLPDRLTSALADRYTLERELGRGGMATVYLAQDVKHDRKVAMKVLHPELAATLGPERFQRE